MYENLYHSKIRIIFVVTLICLVVVVYLIQLFKLQILSPYYKDLAEHNAFFKKISYPARGMIFDRNGILLVHNQLSHDIMVTMNEIKQLDTLHFCKIFHISTKIFRKKMENLKDRHNNPGYSPYIPQIFFSQIKDEEYYIFQELSYKFLGFSAKNKLIRKYNYPYAAHILGYVSRVNKQDILNDPYYQEDDYIGKTGVEHSYEKQLRGMKGVEILLRNAFGRICGMYEKGMYNINPIPGKSLTLSIDINLQAYGEELIKNKLGTIIMIEPKSGEILCMISSPTYDPSSLIKNKNSNFFFQLIKDPYNPLLNRALNGSYPPGSTFKMAQGVIFLQEKIIDPNTIFFCNGGWVAGKGHPSCHKHLSPLNLSLAVETSCNSYFCSGLKSMLENKKYKSIKQAMNVWRNFMINQGFGYPLGIDLPGEKKGMIPNSQYYDKIYGKKWNVFSVISIAIGQGEVSLTPIQICNLAATIANHGHFFIPHIVKKISCSSLDSIYLFPHNTQIEPKYYLPIVEGMRSAVTNGTCCGINIADVEICGKTGTAQNKKKDHSIFMGFAPMKFPQVAILVLIENGGFGSSCAVPIGKLMIQKYFKKNVSTKDKDVENKIKNMVILRYDTTV